MRETAEAGRQENEQYWRQFFEKNRSLIYAICMRYVNDRGIAEDILQEAFIKFFRNFGSIRGSTEAFLKTIAVNLSIDYLRKKKSQREVQIEEGEEIRDGGDDGLTLMAVVRESSRKIREVMKTIDEYCRTFLFYVSQGFKLHEMAAMLKIAEAKIRSDSVRCRRKTICTLCGDALLKKEFSEQERQFIKCYFENIYCSKDKAMKTMGLAEPDFNAIHRSILAKLSGFYSSE